MPGAFTIAPAKNAEMDILRSLFRDYEAAIKTNLCFQGFADELAGLPGKYAPPSGALFLARNSDGEAVGCVALRAMDKPGHCEMKRLYVVPQAKGQGLGRALVQRVLAEARQLGHAMIFLDTLPDMKEAQALYTSLGFADAGAYYGTPIAGTRFMSLAL